VVKGAFVMFRRCLGSAAVVSLLLLGVAVKAEDAKKKEADKNKQHAKATITKVDPKAGTITVKMKDKGGKDAEKTYKLAEDVVYFDSTGRVARLDVFQSGDDVLVLEQEGKLKEVRKDQSKKTDNKDKKTDSKEKSAPDK